MWKTSKWKRFLAHTPAQEPSFSAMWVKSLKIKSVGFNYYFITIIIFIIHFHYFSYHLPVDRSKSILLLEMLILDPHLLILLTEMDTSQLHPTLFALDSSSPISPCQHRRQDLCSAISTFHETLWFLLCLTTQSFLQLLCSFIRLLFSLLPKVRYSLLFTNIPSWFSRFRLYSY